MKAAEQYLGNYRLVRLLGEGRSGEVYLGEHVLLTRPAAVKVIHARFSTQEITRFFQEAKAISRLEHPQIVRVYECDTTGGRPFLVMEYVYGFLPSGLSATSVMWQTMQESACHGFSWTGRRKGQAVLAPVCSSRIKQEGLPLIAVLLHTLPFHACCGRAHQAATVQGEAVCTLPCSKLMK